MKFEEPQIVVVGKAQDVVLGFAQLNPGDNENDDSPNALDLGLDD